jgi:hypothetical protein
MDETPNPYDPQAGSQPTPKLGRRIPRAALAGGIAVGLALGGAGLAYAATSDSSTTTPSASASATSSTTTPPMAKAGHGLRGPRFAFGALGLGGGIVHGTVTVRSGNGYKTVDVQNGQVTSVSSSSITVKSSDGHTQTYAVVSATIVNSQAGGISSVTNGDQVYVVATSKNGTDTAANIVDSSKIENSRGAFGLPMPPKPAEPGSGSSSSDWYGNGSASFGGQAQ